VEIPRKDGLDGGMMDEVAGSLGQAMFRDILHGRHPGFSGLSKVVDLRTKC